MAYYRLYFHAPSGRMQNVSEIHAPSDIAALAEVEKLADGRSMELWNLTRLVQVFGEEPRGRPAAS